MRVGCSLRAQNRSRDLSCSPRKWFKYSHNANPLGLRVSQLQPTRTLAEGKHVEVDHVGGRARFRTHGQQSLRWGTFTLTIPTNPKGSGFLHSISKAPASALMEGPPESFEWVFLGKTRLPTRSHGKPSKKGNRFRNPWLQRLFAFQGGTFLSAH